MTAKRPFPTLNHVWLFAALALIALRALVVPIPPHDFWWHLATGRLIVETGSIPTTDSFSYTQQGQPFYNQGWLAQVLMYGLYRLGGIPLLLLAQAAVVVLAYGLLLWLCIRRSGAVRLSVALLLLTLPLSFDNWHVRPQTYCLPLFAAYLVILTNWRLSSGPRPLWLLPLLMVLWVNLHGTFLLGGGLIGLTFAGVWAGRIWQDWRARRAAAAPPQDARPPLRSLFGWGALTAAAMLLNPRGIGVLGYVFGLLRTSAVTSLVTEWEPTTTRTQTGTVFFLFLLCVIGVLVYARRRPDPLDMLLAAPFFWLALGAERNIIWFMLAITPLLVVQAAGWLPQSPTRRTAPGLPAFNAALIGMVALLLVLALPWIKPHLNLPPTISPLVESNTPIAAVAYLQADPQRPQRLFHAMAYGSYLIWAAPDQPVFIDPRIELYPYKQWLDYINLGAGNSAADLLANYRIDGLLLDNAEQAGLLKLVRADPAWQVRYADDYSTYLTRRP